MELLGIHTAVGNIVFKNILFSNFKGKIFPVNINADSVNGIKAYSTVNELPEVIDLAIIAVPALKVYEAVEEAIKAGAKGIVVVSAGFAETGEEGKERQRKLVDLVRAHGVRLLGPSCLGVMNTDPEVRLNASLAPKIMSPGKAGFFSHSAALGIVILEYAMEKGVEFTTFVSAGNRADVSGNDLLQYWEEDPNTKLAILYLETFGNPRKFVRIARRMTYKKPILCVKSAKSAAGKRAVELKSGSFTGGELEIEALFRQTGIILAPTLEDLFDVAVVLANQPLPRGNNVNIIANSSGMATIFADACEMNNLSIDENGVYDLGAFTNAENYHEAVKSALLKENVDALLVGFACVGDCDVKLVASEIKKGIKEAEEITKIEKPVLLSLMGASGTISLVDEGIVDHNKRSFPAFRFPESAVNALGRIVRYVEFKKQPLGKLVWYNDVSADKARTVIQNVLSKVSEYHKIITINNDDANSILNLFGIKITDIESQLTKNLTIKVRPDTLFGPVIEINVPNNGTIVRITPLTDRDLEKVLKNVPNEINNGIAEILGRISQLIEEIPWLWELEIKIVTIGLPILVSCNKMTIKSGGAERPSY